MPDPSAGTEGVSPLSPSQPDNCEVETDDVLDWEFCIERPPVTAPVILKARIIDVGRAKPLPFTDDSEDRAE
jgi:hypothetical protein